MTIRRSTRRSRALRTMIPSRCVPSLVISDLALTINRYEASLSVTPQAQHRVDTQSRGFLYVVSPKNILRGLCVNSPNRVRTLGVE